jgi:hypothetical protein
MLLFQRLLSISIDIDHTHFQHFIVVDEFRVGHRHELLLDLGFVIACASDEKDTAGDE